MATENRTRKTLLLTSGAQAARILVTIGTGPILSRLLGPAVFGLVAPSQAIGQLGKLVSDSGYSTKVLTDHSLSASQAKDIHRQCLIQSVVLATLAFGVAAAVGHVSPADRIQRGLLAFVSITITGFTAIPIAWAQRQGKMSQVEWISVLAQIACTLLISIPLAYFGLRFLSLSTNLYLSGALAGFFVYRLAKYKEAKPEPIQLDRGYKFRILNVNVAAFLASNVDNLLIATYMSLSALGIYSRIFTLTSLPGSIATTALARLGIIKFSQHKTWPESKRYLAKASAISFGGYFLLALAPMAGFDLMGFAFGAKFATAPSSFLLLVLSQSFFYSGSILDNYLISKAQTTHVSTSHYSKFFLLLALLLIFRPSSFSTIGLILTIGASIRYSYVLWAIYKFSRRDIGENAVSA